MQDTRGPEAVPPEEGPSPLPNCERHITSLIKALESKQGGLKLSNMRTRERYDAFLRYLVSKYPLPDWLHPPRTSQREDSSGGLGEGSRDYDHFIPFNPASEGDKRTETYLSLGWTPPKRAVPRVSFVPIDRKRDRRWTKKGDFHWEEASICVVDISVLEVRLQLSLLNAIPGLFSSKGRSKRTEITSDERSTSRAATSLQMPEGPFAAQAETALEDWFLSVAVEAEVVDEGYRVPDDAIQELFKPLPEPKENVSCPVRASAAPIGKVIEAAAATHDYLSSEQRKGPQEPTELECPTKSEFSVHDGFSTSRNLDISRPKELMVQLPLKAVPVLQVYVPVCCKRGETPDAPALRVRFLFSCEPFSEKAGYKVLLAKGEVFLTRPLFLGFVQLSLTEEIHNRIDFDPGFVGLARLECCCRGLVFRDRRSSHVDSPPPKRESSEHLPESAKRTSGNRLGLDARKDDRKQKQLQPDKQEKEQQKARQGQILQPQAYHHWPRRPLTTASGPPGTPGSPPHASQNWAPPVAETRTASARGDRSRTENAIVSERSSSSSSSTGSSSGSSSPEEQGQGWNEPPANVITLGQLNEQAWQEQHEGVGQQRQMQLQQQQQDWQQGQLRLNEPWQQLQQASWGSDLRGASPHHLTGVDYVEALREGSGMQKQQQLSVHQQQTQTPQQQEPPVTPPGSITLGLHPLHEGTAKKTKEMLRLENLLMQVKQDPCRLATGGLVWARVPGCWPASVEQLREVLVVLKSLKSTARCSVHLVCLYRPQKGPEAAVVAAAEATSRAEIVTSAGLYVLQSVMKQELVDPLVYIRSLLEFSYVPHDPSNDNASPADTACLPLTFIDSPLVVRLQAIYHDTVCVHILREWLPPPARKLSDVLLPKGSCVLNEAAARSVMQQVLQLLQLLQKQRARDIYIQLTPDAIYFRGDGSIALALPRAARFCKKPTPAGPPMVTLLYKPSFQHPLSSFGEGASSKQTNTPDAPASTTESPADCFPLVYLAPEELQWTPPEVGRENPSPSSARGTSAKGAKADLWRLGILAFNLITGGTPFVSNSRAALAALITRRGVIGECLVPSCLLTLQECVCSYR